MPRRDEPVAPFAFGNTAHASFEAFTKERREALARGEPPPTREDLEREFRARWVPTDVRRPGHGGGLRPARRRPCWTTSGRARCHARRGHPRGGATSSCVLERPMTTSRCASAAPSTGSTGCRPAASRSSTTRPARSRRRATWTRACSCRSTRWPAATALGLGTPERVTLYFTESALRLSTTRTDAQLDAARDDILARVAVMRSGEFTATPSARAVRLLRLSGDVPGAGVMAGDATPGLGARRHPGTHPASPWTWLARPSA